MASHHALSAEEPLPPIRYEATAPLMGCTFGIAAYGSDRAALAQQIEAAFDEARKIESWLSNYRSDSELSHLNRDAGGAAIPASDDLFDLLTKAGEYSRASEGGFDMTVGPLVRAWGFYGGSGHRPSDRELEQARQSVGYRLVELDPIRKTVHFTRPGVELDPGGIGKGYAVARMVEILRRAGVRSALVNACNSSIYGLGAPPDSQRGWRIEIERPGSDRTVIGRDPTDVGSGPPGVEVIFLKNQSLSTSGSQEKSFEQDGHLYSHIIDPRTGQPTQGLLSVSVIAPRALDSEVWSTAIFVNGLEWAASHAPKPLRIYGCPTGQDCRWIRE